MTPDLSRTLNAIGMLAVSLVLVLAYVYQLALYELPCPLCLLQRVGFVAVGVGLGLNLLYGPRPQHYAMVLIAALYGGSVSVRQILLHIVPGTGHYGSPVLGLHYYTWAAICFFLILLGTAIMLMFDRQYVDDRRAQPRFGGNRLAKVAFFVMLGLAVLNAGSTLLECGPGVCADPPTDYKLIDDLAPGN
ncbi:Disulfide bond formation protein DsbB [Ruegeria intermedia]|uniref:Disulfide bond formation protein DsbB n=1 Tax=Ruegeria intermedia TaxID=996115 RepID=A0A1M4XCS9_9RHOB|nr:disulfide bond formation protein B [Ruegeria intermedia]SHE91203.1 Disulfide bond formation protein DsbB [Ruegeria intermedia]